MKKILLLLIIVLSATTLHAQYNDMEPRPDYLDAFKKSGQNITWSRVVVTDKERTELIAEIAMRVSVSTIVEDMILGKIEDFHPGKGASFSTGRLPWDGSVVKANVVYELTDNGYIVKVSNIMYQNDALDSDYSSIYTTIYNKQGELRWRGDGDLRYFDNAFCDILLIE